MIHVLLDTNILDRDPRKASAAFRAIGLLAEHDHVRIHIPEIVKREHVSHLFEKQSSELVKILSASKRLSRLGLTAENQDEIMRQIELLGRMNSSIEMDVAQGFEGWIAETRAVVHEGTNEFSNAVMQSYFQGSPPYKTKRAKDDIPDAFIFEVTKDLALQLGEVHFVSLDSNLRTHLETQENVLCYAQLQDFVQSEQCALAIADTRIFTYLPVFKGAIIDSNDEHWVDAWDIAEQQIIGTSVSLPGTSSSSQVSAVYDVQKVNLDAENIHYFGSGIFESTQIISMEIAVWDQLHISEYYEIESDANRNIQMLTSVNDDFVETEELVHASVELVITFEFDPTLIPTEGEITRTVLDETYNIPALIVDVRADDLQVQD